MTRLEFTQEVTCTECGHKGNLFLEGEERSRFLRESCWSWFSSVGWKLWMITFTTASVLGFLYGVWLP